MSDNQSVFLVRREIDVMELLRDHSLMHHKLEPVHVLVNSERLLERITVALWLLGRLLAL